MQKTAVIPAKIEHKGKDPKKGKAAIYFYQTNHDLSSMTYRKPRVQIFSLLCFGVRGRRWGRHLSPTRPKVSRAPQGLKYLLLPHTRGPQVLLMCSTPYKSIRLPFDVGVTRHTFNGFKPIIIVPRETSQTNGPYLSLFTNSCCTKSHIIAGSNFP